MNRIPSDIVGRAASPVRTPTRLNSGSPGSRPGPVLERRQSSPTRSGWSPERLNQLASPAVRNQGEYVAPVNAARYVERPVSSYGKASPVRSRGGAASPQRRSSSPSRPTYQFPQTPRYTRSPQLEKSSLAARFRYDRNQVLNRPESPPPVARKRSEIPMPAQHPSQLYFSPKSDLNGEEFEYESFGIANETLPLSEMRTPSPLTMRNNRVSDEMLLQGIERRNSGLVLTEPPQRPYTGHTLAITIETLKKLAMYHEHVIGFEPDTTDGMRQIQQAVFQSESSRMSDLALKLENNELSNPKVFKDIAIFYAQELAVRLQDDYHKHHRTHGDVRPENFLVGYPEEGGMRLTDNPLWQEAGDVSGCANEVREFGRVYLAIRGVYPGANPWQIGSEPVGGMKSYIKRLPNETIDSKERVLLMNIFRQNIEKRFKMDVVVSRIKAFLNEEEQRIVESIRDWARSKGVPL